jgi:hypothetical protein
MISINGEPLGLRGRQGVPTPLCYQYKRCFGVDYDGRMNDTIDRNLTVKEKSADGPVEDNGELRSPVRAGNFAAAAGQLGVSRVIVMVAASRE